MCYDKCADGDVMMRNFNNYCDDGNKVNGDGCSSDCHIEQGWTCSGGTSTSSDSCTPICGDGLIRGTEQCDDDNTANGDGCSSSCKIENGWRCRVNPTNGWTTCSPICGDGL